jgi:hypothetical protein
MHVGTTVATGIARGGVTPPSGDPNIPQKGCEMTHQTVSLEATAARHNCTLPAGSTLISTAQPLGTLALYLLEPMSEDGLATWNFFDGQLEVGREFPVVRLVSPDR